MKYVYRFSLFSSINAPQATMTGTGMERFDFDDDGKLTRDEIHLIFDQINVARALGISRDSIQARD